MQGCRMTRKAKVFSHIFICVMVLTFAMAVSPASAAPGDAANGKKIYMKKCWWCHGKDGEADGPAAKFMIPPPRNFADGVYKYKTAPPKSEIVRDEDIFRAITEGLNGTVMPSWEEILSEKERWDLVAHIKTLTDMFEDEANPPQIDYGTIIESSPESIEKGKKLFKDTKCFECHGLVGKGNTQKKLKEDSGAKLWPRNLSMPWNFRGGSDPKDIFTRISNGIPNTPMPSHAADTTGNGKLSVEDRWHVVNFVVSLADYSRKTKEGKIVIQGVQKTAIPKDQNDPAWSDVNGTAFFLVPQIIEKERFFTPANDIVVVKAVFTDQDIAFLLEWDDRTKSVVGDKVAEGLAWGKLNSDAIAIQTPVEIPEFAEKPYFGHGDSSLGVSMLYWNSGSVDKPNTSKVMKANGTGKREESDASAAGFTVSSSYSNGTWKVMMKRKLVTPNKEKDTQFKSGVYIPIAFANWDGSNGEGGSKHTMTTWYWLLLKPETGSKVVVFPAAVFFILVAGQLVLARIGKKE